MLALDRDQGETDRMVAIWFAAGAGAVGLLLVLVGSILIVRAAELQAAKRFGVEEGEPPKLDIGAILKELGAFIKELGNYLGPDPRARAGGLLAALGVVIVLASLVVVASVSGSLR